MENAVEALKIAFGVALFVIALTLSISCFSQANTAVSAITTLRDRDIRYEQIKPSEFGLTRIVGVETIVPTMYTAYNENIEIYFQDRNGRPLPIYYKTDSNGNRIKNNGVDEIIDYIDLAKESFGNDGDKPAAQVAREHLDILLEIGYNNKNTAEKYKNQIHEKYPNGFYNFLKDNKFEECLGEYYQGSDTANSIKKRVITYKLQ